MYICKNCGMTYSHQAKFCERCGSAIVDTNYIAPNIPPAYATTPQNSIPDFNNSYPAQNQTPSYDSSYSPYASQPQASVSGGSKALGIIGMSLGIFNIIMSLFTFIASCGAIGMADDYSYYYYYNYHEDEIFGIFFFTFVILITSIAGLVLSSISRNKGFTSGISKTGKVLGILSTIFNAISCFLALIAIGMIA